MTPKEWAEIAQLAYTSEPSIGDESSAARIVYVESDDGLILAIPGTNNMACILVDLDTFLKDAQDCGMVHQGIWEAFDPVWDVVSGLNVNAIVGHSEGAAGAIYLGARLCLIGKPPKVIYAWEPPRTSIDTKLADIFLANNVDLHIMWHGNDIVPDVPPSWEHFTWQHAGKPEKFGNASSSEPNIEDHFIENIIKDL